MNKQLETKLEFMYSCRGELLWRRPLQFKIKFNTVLSVGTVSLFNCQTAYIHFMHSVQRMHTHLNMWKSITTDSLKPGGYCMCHLL
jgi:hypothetical protein